ncbi:hypothetical protein GvMRE_Ic1g124 [endosymbiont GvMRE of Glomus versiforme]|nr:hypothetical protein GvMRE_Ic1g124 [endosymbiont GvMRE of Glomus versiforme]
MVIKLDEHRGDAAKRFIHRIEGGTHRGLLESFGDYAKNTIFEAVQASIKSNNEKEIKEAVNEWVRFSFDGVDTGRSSLKWLRSRARAKQYGLNEETTKKIDALNTALSARNAFQPGNATNLQDALNNLATDPAFLTHAKNNFITSRLDDGANKMVNNYGINLDRDKNLVRNCINNMTSVADLYFLFNFFEDATKVVNRGDEAIHTLLAGVLFDPNDIRRNSIDNRGDFYDDADPDNPNFNNYFNIRSYTMGKICGDFQPIFHNWTIDNTLEDLKTKLGLIWEEIALYTRLIQEGKAAKRVLANNDDFFQQVVNSEADWWTFFRRINDEGTRKALGNNKITQAFRWGFRKTAITGNLVARTVADDVIDSYRMGDDGNADLQITGYAAGLLYNSGVGRAMITVLANTTTAATDTANPDVRTEPWLKDVVEHSSLTYNPLSAYTGVVGNLFLLNTWVDSQIALTAEEQTFISDDALDTAEAKHNAAVLLSTLRAIKGANTGNNYLLNEARNNWFTKDQTAIDTAIADGTVNADQLAVLQEFEQAYRDNPNSHKGKVWTRANHDDFNTLHTTRVEGLANKVLNRATRMHATTNLKDFRDIRFKGNRVDRNYTANDRVGETAGAGVITAYDAKDLSKKAAGLLYNLGIEHENVHNNTHADDGTRANAFDIGDGTRFDLTNEANSAAGGLWGFVQAKSLAVNPLSNDGQGNWADTGTNGVNLDPAEEAIINRAGLITAESKHAAAVLLAHLREIKGASGIAGINQQLNPRGRCSERLN